MATWHTCFGHLVDVLARALAGESINTTVELAGTVYEIRSTSLRAENGEITGVIGAATDFTERKRAEEEIKEGNRRLEGIAVLKADFTAMIAHELDTPLVVIRWYADMLATGELEAPGWDHALTKIQTGTDVMAALIADTRTAAIEREDFAVKPRRTPIGDLMKDAFAETLCGGRPVVIDNAADGQVWAYPYKIGQVLRSLLSNAAKYSPEDAQIEPRAAPGDKPGHIRIEVADQGGGVHPNDASRIFGKVEVHSRLQELVFAVRHGGVEIG